MIPYLYKLMSPKNLRLLEIYYKRILLIVMPIRDPYNKWYSPHYMYDKKRYPNYLSGTGYVMSKSTALTLYEASIDTPIFHMEDIYVTGILAQKSGIRPQDNVGFSYLKRRAT